MKRTQCPNCLSVFLISDHQFSVSKGKVRCGSCRQPFYAEFLDEPDQVRPAPEPVTGTSATTSATTSAPANAPANARDADKPTTRIAPTIEPSSRPDWQDELRDMQKDWQLDVQADDPVAPEFAADDPVGAEFDTNTISFTDAEYDPRFADNLHSELSIEFDDETSFNPPQETPAQTSTPETENETQRSSLSGKLLRRRQQQLDLEVPAELTDEPAVAPGESGLDDQTLIQDVDKLIDEKLTSRTGLDESQDEQLTRDWSGFDVESTTEVESSQSLQESPQQAASEFALDQAPRAGVFQRWIIRPFLALLCLALLLILLTQLWYRQWLPPADTPVIKQVSDASLKPLAEWLQPVQDSLDNVSAQLLGQSLPERRNLARMFLLSSNTEPHPSRSSTILLKVGVVNRAEIPQPWPWLELSLTEENGRLVSRRNLDPADYLHNNDLPDQLAPNELRQVTIELLNFPELATGYELKILNK